VTFVIGIAGFVVSPFVSVRRRFIVVGMNIRQGVVTASLLVVVVSCMSIVACNKHDDSSASPSSSAQAAPSGSGEEGRRGHEHDWDGGRDHGDHPR